MINFITVLLLAPTISYILNQYFNIGFRLKLIYIKFDKRFKEWDEIKPFSCDFCMHFWITNIITLSLSWLFIPQITIILFCTNTYFAHLMENKNNKQ